MREAAEELGLDLSQHRSQLVTPKLLQWAQKVVYMDGGNLQRLWDAGCPVSKTCPLGAYALPPVARVPDPNYMKRGSADFTSVVQLIVNASRQLAKELCHG